jgi:membrane protease YdiL (CAAX protease family)
MEDRRDEATLPAGHTVDLSDPSTKAVVPRPEPQPRVWPTFVVPLVGLLLAVVLQAIVAAGVTAMLLASGVDRSELGSQIMEWLTSPVGFLAILACGQVGFAVPTLLAAALSPEPFRRRLGLVPLRNPVQFSAMIALGSLLPVAVGFGLVHLVLKFIPADDTFENFFEKLTLAWGIVFVIVIALAPGFFEEMLFRGYVQGRLLKRWRPAWAIGVASLLFALAHVTPHAIALAAPLGLWFGIVAWRTGSIIPTIVSHAFVNGGVNTWRLWIKFGELSETAQLVGNAVGVGVGIVCFVIACRLLAACPTPGTSHPASAAESALDEGTAAASRRG